MHDYDKSSKWLIEHHGDSILRLAGMSNIRSWKPLQAELAQPRQLPDGLLEVQFADQSEQDLFLIEIATYFEERLIEQMTRDVMLVYLDRRQLPEAIVLILHPRGGAAARDALHAQSRLGTVDLHLRWRVVRLWELTADELLATGDVGLIPWVPLSNFTGPPEPILQRCRDAIDQAGSADERANLLAVSQVMTRLRYNDRSLLRIFGGSQAMIESPLIQELQAKTRHEAMLEAIMTILETRFGAVPPEIAVALQGVGEPLKLLKLTRNAVVCADFDEFRRLIES